MTLKSYFSGTVEAAMELARKELGEDALLVNARPSTPETRYLGAYEVVFGLVPKAGATFEASAIQLPPDRPATRPLVMAAAAGAGKSSAPSAPRLPVEPARTKKATDTHGSRTPIQLQGAPAKSESPTGPFAQNVARLRLEIAHLSNTARPQSVPVRQLTAQLPQRPDPKRPNPNSARRYFEPTYFEPISSPEQPSGFAQPLHDERREPQRATFPRLNRQEIGDERQEFVDQKPPPRQRTSTVDPTLGCPNAAQAVVAFVGPPGAGKTTSLIKLAAKYGLGQRKSVQILTADVHRIAAADQLRSLAAILGIGCEVAQTPQMLLRQLEQHRDKELILIDTPGFGGAEAELDDARELSEVLHASDSNCPIDVHLVLPATMSRADMDRAIARYANFQPSKVLFTRLDETGQPEAMLQAAAENQLPISFLANGQQMPDDLLEADAEWLQSVASPPARPQKQPRDRIAAYPSYPVGYPRASDPTAQWPSQPQPSAALWTTTFPNLEQSPARRAMAAGAGR